MLRITVAALALSAPVLAQAIQPPFNQDYTLVDLGQPAGVPTPFGGLMITPQQPNVLLLMGNGNQSVGALYAVPITRDSNGEITGFAGPGVSVASAPHNDGGLTLGPGGQILFTRYSQNELGQIAAGSATMTKSVALSPLGVSSSVGAMNIVPPGYPSAGHIKFAAFNSSVWHDATLAPDGQGTFDVTNVGVGIQIQGGPEGIAYPPQGSPRIPDFSAVMVSEYSAGVVAVYDIDANADPIRSTRRVFINGLTGAEGANIDPVTGSFLFSTFGSGRVYAVKGFGTCGTYQNFGQGTVGFGGQAPSITGVGCPLTGNDISIEITGAPPLAIGALNLGSVATNVTIQGVTVLTNVEDAWPHLTDAQGSWTLTRQIPNTGAFAGFTVYFQAGYLDNAAALGVSATEGLRMTIQ